MRKRIAALILALAIGLGFGVSNSGVALANSPGLNKVYNDTSNGTIEVQFHTPNGQWVYQNLAPGTWQGEVYGNQTYEPRAIHLGALWCLTYFFKYTDAAAGPTYTACGGSAGGWLNVYTGDGDTRNLNVHVRTVYYRGY